MLVRLVIDFFNDINDGAVFRKTSIGKPSRCLIGQPLSVSKWPDTILLWQKKLLLLLVSFGLETLCGYIRL